MKKKDLRDYFDWRRIVNTYRNIEDITEEDWGAINRAVSDCFRDNPGDEQLLRNSAEYFNLIIALVPFEITLGELLEDFQVNYEILFLGKRLKTRFGVELMVDFLLYHSFDVVRELTDLLVEGIQREINCAENDL